MLKANEELFLKIQGIPWQALYDEAISRNIDSNEIESKSKEELLQVLCSKGISEKDMQEIVNKYMYGKRISFIIWRFSDTVSVEDKENILNLIESDIYTEEKGFRNIRIQNVIAHEDRLEILYVYSKIYTFINEMGKADKVWEQHCGCSWVGLDTTYIANIGKHEKISKIITQKIEKVIQQSATQIRPPYSAIKKCFNSPILSRIVLVGSEGEKTVIARAEGLTKQQLKEKGRVEADRASVSGSYKMNIGLTENITVRFNSIKGTISILKHLPVEELFEWSKEAINIILEELELLKSKPAEEIFRELGKTITWNNLNNQEESQMNVILSAILDDRENNDSNNPLDNSMSDVLDNPKLFSKVFRPYCNICQSSEVAFCKNCGRVLTTEIIKKGTCTCKEKVQAICSEGHYISTTSLDDYWYMPTDNTLRQIENNVKKVFPNFILPQLWFIANRILKIFRKTKEAEEVRFEEIECFKLDLACKQKQLKEYVVDMQEKCSGGCSYKKCTLCNTSPQKLCLMRIFSPIIPGYRPQPHKVGEYGDISGEVTVKGRKLELKGILKKNTSTSKDKTTKINTPLLSTSGNGQEIIRQIVEQGLIDARCDLIAIVAPQYIDAGFKGTLRYLCALANKKIIFIELDELCMVVSQLKEYYLKNYDIADIPDAILKIPSKAP